MTVIGFRSKGASYKLIEFERLSTRQSFLKNVSPATETQYLWINFKFMIENDPAFQV